MLDIFINTDATPDNSIALSVENPVSASLKALVFGDTLATRIFLTTAAGTIDAVSGNASYTIKAGIGSRNAAPTGGTFTLTFGANTTTALAYNATAAVIQAALEALASIGSGNVRVTGPAPALNVEFIGTLALENQTSLIVAATSLTPSSSATLSVIQDGSGTQNEIQFIFLAQQPAFVSSAWTRITSPANGWSGQISAARKGIFDAFAGKSSPVQLYFEVEVTDAGGLPRTYCSVPINILPQVVDQNAIGGNTVASFYLTQEQSDARYVLQIPAGANYRFKSGQLQIWDATQAAATPLTPWRAIGCDAGALFVSDPIAD